MIYVTYYIYASLKVFWTSQLFCLGQAFEAQLARSKVHFCPAVGRFIHPGAAKKTNVPCVNCGHRYQQWPIKSKWPTCWYKHIQYHDYIDWVGTIPKNVIRTYPNTHPSAAVAFVVFVFSVWRLILVCSSPVAVCMQLQYMDWRFPKSPSWVFSSNTQTSIPYSLNGSRIKRKNYKKIHEHSSCPSTFSFEYLILKTTSFNRFATTTCLQGTWCS